MTKPCPECRRLMIVVESGLQLLSDPPVPLTNWRCGCGYKEPGPEQRQTGHEQLFMERWAVAQE